MCQSSSTEIAQTTLIIPMSVCPYIKCLTDKIKNVDPESRVKEIQLLGGTSFEELRAVPNLGGPHDMQLCDLAEHWCMS